MAVASSPALNSVGSSHSLPLSRPSVWGLIAFRSPRSSSKLQILSKRLDLKAKDHSEIAVIGATNEADSEALWLGREGWGRRSRRRKGGVAKCSAGGIVERAEQQATLIPERAKVLALLAMVMCLCNADRVVMSVAIVPLASRYGWSSSFFGIVQSSFLWGYLISSIAGGALADRYGGKRVMACGAAIWSLATFLTPWAANHSTAMLLAIRALFGLAEGVAFPCMSTLLFRWFPCNERASALGISMAGFHLGNVISFLASPIILSSIGLNGSFIFFASLGFLWVLVWLVGITNDPRDSPHISQAELQLIQAGKKDLKMEKIPSFSYLLSKLPAWSCILANMTNNWGYFVLLTWMPMYFKTVYDVNLKQAAWFSAVPWAAMALSGYVAGATSDFMIKSGCSIIKVRKIMQTIGFIGPALSLLSLRYAQTSTRAAVLMTLALSFSSFSQAGYMLNIQDIAPKYAGFLHGITNSAGTFAAIISTAGIGYFVEWLGSFQAFLTLTAAVYLTATIFYNLHATAEQVFF
ncbi:putative anion transporter 2, chloroplastic [Curcuma longa]|uniref:putative anion transporter 2, chloroplastic n=1 Tax=Curcuma longa TaxID=136217 RepID=UPI003D9F0F1C